MKWKIKTNHLLITLICCSMISCKKLLEIPPNPADKISGQQAFSDSNNVQNVMAGLYSSFKVLDNGFADLNAGGMTIYGGLSADELINLEPSQVRFRQPFQDNAVLPTNQLLPYMWSAAYTTIYIANAALEGITASNGLSAGLKQRLTGELKTVRAFCYFDLVNLFGGVPLPTTTDYRKNAVLPRETVDKTYELIVTDLLDASTLLVEDYPSAGHSRPNLYTVKALLAKVYLYRKEWQKAADLSTEVINSPMYSLEPDLNNVFLSGSPEAIWQYPVAGAGYSQTNEGNIFIPYDEETQPNYILRPELLNDFETDDQRKTSWTADLVVDGVDYIIPFKYKNKDNYTNPTVEDYMIFRLGEQYLIRAEALAQLDKPDEALADVNVIRTRAGLPELSYSTKPALLADIIHERRIELFCEWGNRWLDLKRTDQATAVLAPIKPGWQPTAILFPVPQIELNSNPFLKQNPGY